MQGACRDSSSVPGCEEPVPGAAGSGTIGGVSSGTPSRSEPAAPAALSEAPSLADFLSRSPRMRAFLRMVKWATLGTSSILITGETGVGKERLARAIHAGSERREGPFVSVNCGALPEGLLESELFGHEAGAFTGATQRRAGRFEQAHRGTIFLDEIGEMPRHLQVSLLSVIQGREVRRLGGEQTIPIDIRIMAATNRDLAQDVAEGRFREDLFYRLDVLSFTVPPLRERREDVPDLVASFVRHFRERLDRPDVTGWTAEALQALVAHRWPGNVRELINVVERAVLLCEGPLVTLDDLPDRLRDAPAASAPAELAASPSPAPAALVAPDAPGWADRTLREVRDEALAAVERAYLEAVLRRTQGRVAEAAGLAGISPRHLHTKMKEHGLRKEWFKPPG